MDKRPKQDPEPAKPRPQPAPGQREDRRDKQSDKEGDRQGTRPLGDDPDSEGGDNTSLPEGSAGGRTLAADSAEAADAPQTSDRRGTGSAKPSNVRRDRTRR